VGEEEVRHRENTTKETGDDGAVDEAGGAWYLSGLSFHFQC
jgi:hypothetical protein